MGAVGAGMGGGVGAGGMGVGSGVEGSETGTDVEARGGRFLKVAACQRQRAKAAAAPKNRATLE